MKVFAYQIEPKLLDLKGNLEQVLAKIHQGKEKGADLVVFPELALTGYFLGQRYHEVALRLDSKEILFAYRKLNLPNYGLFEERKYFSPGKQVPVFRLHDFNVAVFICNDLWHPSLPYLGVCQKADVFVTLFNSSEGSMGTEFSNIESWRIINTFYSRVFGIYNICVNRVGEESWEEKLSFLAAETDRIVRPKARKAALEKLSFRFWGGSEIINPFGQQIAKAALYEPDEIFTEISKDLLRRKRILLPYLRNDDPYFTHRELQRILFKKRGRDH